MVTNACALFSARHVRSHRPNNAGTRTARIRSS
jgi:hypothetical protein